MSQSSRELLVPPLASNRLSFDTAVVGRRSVTVSNIGRNVVSARMLRSQDGISFHRSGGVSFVNPGGPLIVQLPEAPYAALLFRSRQGTTVRVTWDFKAGGGT